MITDVKTLGDLVDRAAALWPQREAVVFEGQRISYSKLQATVNKLAVALLKLGVRKGDKVAVLFTNRPQWAFSEYAIDKLGAIVVPINTRYTVDEMTYILNHSDATTLIMMDRFQQISYITMINEICPTLSNAAPGQLSCQKVPFLKNIIVFGSEKYPGTFNLGDMMKEAAESDLTEIAKVQALVGPDDIAHLPYTSGTTGKPKGVMTTHRQYIRFNTGFINGIGGFDEEDRLCVAPPFSHNFGNSQGILTPSFCGSTSVLLESFDAEACMELIEKEGCTFFAGSPTMYIKMLRHEKFSTHNLSSLRAGLIAAAPAPVSIINEIKQRMGIRILVNGFGMTENSVGTSMTRPEDPSEILSSTVGRPLWEDYEVKVVDIRTGRDLPPESEGELCTRGPLIMKGYYKMHEETASLIDGEGWFHTGDLGAIDESGYIRITGRLKDVFMPGGLNVSPEEVENVFYANPKVKQAAVFGVPDEVMGEVGAAYVELKMGEQCSERELKEFCKGRLANFKIPKYVVFTDDFPMTTSGKIQKFLLKERAVKKLGLQDKR